MTTEADTTPAPRPVVVDRTKLTIPDLRLLASSAFPVPMPADQTDLAAMQAAAQAAAQRVMDLIDMLERVIEGGMAERSADDLWPLVNEVSAQINAPQKNSRAGS